MGTKNLFQPGQSGNPNGRPKGSKNKNTEAIRQAYQKLTEDNLENMSLWLTDIAGDDPAKAMDLMLKLSEYIIPKLQRQEITGTDGEDLFKNVKFQFGPDVNDTEERIHDTKLKSDGRHQQDGETGMDSMLIRLQKSTSYETYTDGHLDYTHEL